MPAHFNLGRNLRTKDSCSNYDSTFLTLVTMVTMIIHWFARLVFSVRDLGTKLVGNFNGESCVLSNLSIHGGLPVEPYFVTDCGLCPLVSIANIHIQLLSYKCNSCEAYKVISLQN